MLGPTYSLRSVVIHVAIMIEVREWSDKEARESAVRRLQRELAKGGIDFYDIADVEVIHG